MKQIKRISATELGKINKISREWNTYTFMHKVDEYSEGLIKNYPKSAWVSGFLELISPILNWL